MKQIIILMLAILGLYPQIAFSTEKIDILPGRGAIINKQHPYTRQLCAKPIKQKIKTSKNINNNKLLIILVGFKEEIIDNPNTTGNGQFQLEAPSNYLANISRPPHNQEYYDKMAEAMRYYYLACSFESYNLEWDIYPKNKSCYTLPEEMAYYNPIGLNGTDFTNKQIEYVTTAWQTADKESPEIDFSSYGHFMIIHAGSDWQHDILSNTKNDIPSYFMNIGDGKEIAVDEGNFFITKTCNIPETITQDTSSSEFNGSTLYSGYGALNGVMFHEFGHSLGTLDLYSVKTHRPIVGSFDIMDSGGSIEVILPQDGNYFSVEGLIPGLPGAYSRMLMFEDIFKENGIYKEITSGHYEISCPEQKLSSNETPKIPSIYRLDISDDEYVLIENRCIDPDEDGGASVVSALDKRIALYPSKTGSSNERTYEYDYLLPSFISTKNNSTIGGGLLMWKIDNNEIYNKGSYDTNGNFVSNFASNSINKYYHHPGVKIIEADGIPDLGNIYAKYWKGTAFEYFFKTMPLLNSDGLFTGWDTDKIHNNMLNGTTTPSLRTRNDLASSFGISNVSNMGANMSFDVNLAMFENSSSFDVSDEILSVSPVFFGELLQQPEFAVVKSDKIQFYNYDASKNEFSLFVNTSLENGDNISNIKYNVVKGDNHVWFTSNNKVYVLKNSTYFYKDFNDDIISQPICVKKDDIYHYICMTEKSIYDFYFYKENKEIIANVKENNGFTKSLYIDDKVFFYNDEKIVLDNDENITYTLPEKTSIHKPVFVYNDMGEATFVVLTDSNRLFAVSDKENKLIKDLNLDSITETTELALYKESEDAQPVVIFASNNKVFGYYFDGSVFQDYPGSFENIEFTPNRDIIIISNKDNDKILSNSLYLPVNDSEYVALEIQKYDDINSTINALAIRNDFTLMDTFENKQFTSFNNDKIRLNRLFILMNNKNSLNINWNSSEFLESDMKWNPITYNIGRGIKTKFYSDYENNNNFNAFIFPTPIRDKYAYVRVVGANGDVSFKLYSISGKIVYETNFTTINNAYTDELFDTSTLASGVYFAIIEATTDNGKQTKKFKTAIIK